MLQIELNIEEEHFIYQDESITSLSTNNINLLLPTYVVLSEGPRIVEVFLDSKLNNTFFSMENAYYCCKYIRTGLLTEPVVNAIYNLLGIENKPVRSTTLMNLKQKQAVCLEEKCNKCVLECNHPICYDCMYTNLSNYSNRCPMCRREIKEEEIEVSENDKMLAHFINYYCFRCNTCDIHIDINKKIKEFIDSGGAVKNF